MDIYISSASAYSFWVSGISRDGLPVLHMEANSRYISNKMVNYACEVIKPNAGKLCLAAANSGARGKSKLAKFHIDKKAPLYHRYLQIDEEIAVSDPETCFLEMAHSASKPDLIVAGYHLCAAYFIHEGKIVQRQPLTTVAKLLEFVKSCPDTNAARLAKSALRYVRDNSKSPMETYLSLSFVVPRNYGGYRLPLPALNRRIEADPHSKILRKYFECDLYWDSAKVAVEYDSNEFHALEKKISMDSTRRAELAALGVHTLSITASQFYNLIEFDVFAHALGALLGKTVPMSSQDFLRKRILLRDFIKEKQVQESQQQFTVA